MTLGTARAQGIALLEKGGVGVPALTAEVLLCHALHCGRSYLYAHPEQTLKEVEWIHYGRYLHERLQGKPTQYITKRQEFYGREFRVSPDALIPRPETEHLVESVLKELSGGRLVDVGTGTGAIAVTLALEANYQVVASDISAAALSLASTNAARLNARVDFVRMDLLTGFANSAFDAVVSNPPYIPAEDRATMAREVVDWEPSLALFAGETGLDIYRRLIPEAQRVLRPGGLLAMEFGFGQTEAMLALLHDWDAVKIGEDLAGIPRVANARRRPL